MEKSLICEQTHPSQHLCKDFESRNQNFFTFRFHLKSLILPQAQGENQIPPSLPKKVNAVIIPADIAVGCLDNRVIAKVSDWTSIKYICQYRAADYQTWRKKSFIIYLSWVFLLLILSQQIWWFFTLLALDVTQWK